MRKVICLLITILLLQASLNISSCLPPAEIDLTAVPLAISDGDTFNSFPAGPIRLADLNAPEENQPGYTEALEALGSLILDKRVYLDVDDRNIHSYSRLVCVVYVRYNSTHLLNVNKSLLDQKVVYPVDLDNEFNPETWTPYVYYPASLLPETSYRDLIEEYFELQINLSQIQVDYNNLFKEFNTLTTNFNNLNDTYDQLQLSQNELQTELSTLKIQNNNLQQHTNSLQQQIDNLQTEVNNSEFQKSKLEIQISNLEQQKSTLEILTTATIASCILLLAVTIYIAKKR